MPSKFHVNDCPERLKSIRSLLHLLSTEGRSVPGVSSTINPDVKPAWFDEDLFKRGQSFAIKYTVRSVSVMQHHGKQLNLHQNLLIICEKLFSDAIFLQSEHFSSHGTTDGTSVTKRTGSFTGNWKS